MSKEKKLGRGLEDFSHLFISSDDEKDKNLVPEKNKKHLKPINSVTPTSVVCITSHYKVIIRAFLTICLANEFSRLGKKVLLFDADFSLPRLSMLMKKSNNGSILKFISSNNSVNRIGEFVNGINLITLDVDLEDHSYLALNKLDALARCFKEAENEADLILVTAKPYLNFRFNKNVIGASDEVIVVTPRPSKEMVNSYRVIKTIFQINNSASVGIVSSRIEEHHQESEVFKKMNYAVQKHLNSSILNYGYIPDDTEISLSIAKGNPLTGLSTESEIAQCVSKISDKLIQKIGALKSKSSAREYPISFAEKVFSNSFIEHFE